MLKIGIVGLPNVGKSTLFNALTKASVPAENYPFCTIDPSVGVVGVPDARLAELAKLSKSEKVIPAAIEFVDIAGLVAGAAQGEGLGNQFLSHIRETDAILQVVRFFDDPAVLHVDGTIEPYKDIEIINMELMLADAEQVRKRRDKLERDITTGVKDAPALDAALAKLEQGFAAGKLALHAGLADEERKRVAHMNLLTMKPMLYALNRKSGGHNLDELADGRAARANQDRFLSRIRLRLLYETEQLIFSRVLPRLRPRWRFPLCGTLVVPRGQHIKLCPKTTGDDLAGHKTIYGHIAIGPLSAPKRAITCDDRPWPDRHAPGRKEQSARTRHLGRSGTPRHHYARISPIWIIPRNILCDIRRRYPRV